jgi:hypothetical protein
VIPRDKHTLLGIRREYVVDMSNANEDRITHNTVGFFPMSVPRFSWETLREMYLRNIQIRYACREDLGRYRGTVGTLSQSSVNSSEPTSVGAAMDDMSVTVGVCVEQVDPRERPGGCRC